MKKTGCLVCLIAVAALVVVLRLNLPPAEVSAAVDLSEVRSGNALSRIVGSMAMELMVTDEVASWTYHDYVIFRTAKSKRLGWSALALPFSKWKVDTGKE